jgi:hypothetical protein
MQLRLDSLRFPFVVLLLMGLMLADGTISEFIVRAGLGRESNPVMRFFLASGSFMPVKIAGALLAALLLSGMYRRNSKTAIKAAWLFVSVYTVIVFWNVGGLLLSTHR